jgi:hypothetical protein
MNNSIFITRLGEQRNLIVSFLVGAVAILMLASCASTDVPPTKEINSAEQAIHDAEQARVTDYALPELQEARAKLSAARIAVTEEKLETARRLAQQSSVYVELAFAKAELQKAQAVNAEMEKNITVLKQEMNRNTGGQK